MPCGERDDSLASLALRLCLVRGLVVSSDRTMDFRVTVTYNNTCIWIGTVIVRKVRTLVCQCGQGVL